jgi:7-carboxy-7-deazaguanine synthase
MAKRGMNARPDVLATHPGKHILTWLMFRNRSLPRDAVALNGRLDRVIRVAEIFHSIQGEGFLSGTPSVFIRTSGCNLRCWYCDTRYASWDPEGDSRDVEAILASAFKWPTEHVVITGGEPMIFDELAALCQGLREAGKHITIETAGTVDRDVPCDLWSISPKLSNSTPVGFANDTWVAHHEERRHRPDIVEAIMQRGEYQLKFVVGSILDAEEVLESLSALRGWSRDRVMLMPRGITSQELHLQTDWLTQWCRAHDLRLCDRLHIHWFGNRRGT